MLALYAITDRGCLRGRDLCEQVEMAILGGATMVQLREKKIDTVQLSKIAAELLKICRKYQIPLIINDDWRAAVLSGADGVHVGLEDDSVAEIRRNTPSGFIIGATAKTVEQAQTAQAQGADYIGVGAVFPSPTKTNAVRITPDQLREICRSVDIPAVAIGGISGENLWSLRGCANRGIAVVSAIFGTEDVRSAAENLHEKWRRVDSFRTALTIAGSDCSGGAGVQADIKSMMANGVYAMSAVTALTAQNSTGVYGICNTPPQFLADQIDAVFSDIRPDAVKIGMIPTAKAAEVIADRLKFWRAEHIVVDPVGVSSSGSELSPESAYKAINRFLFPIAELITPNAPETAVIAGMSVSDEDDLVRSARNIADKYGCNVLCKGGHLAGDDVKNFLALKSGGTIVISSPRIDNHNIHGTGCTLSSAVAANLAKGMSLENAVRSAERYVSGAIGARIDLGRGNGPLHHGFCSSGFDENRSCPE